MARFIFEVVLMGEGDTAEEAWQDAVEALSADPGEPENAREVEDED
jgi:hypothetical protein